MYKVAKKLQANGSVIAIQDGANLFFVLDNTYNVYFVDKRNLEVKKNFSAGANYSNLHKFSKSCDISKMGHFNINIEKKSSSLLITTDGGVKKQKVIDNHRKDLTVSRFSHNSKYLATGGEDGKIFIFDLRHYKMIAALPNKPDYIADLKFSSDDDFLITTCFDRSLFIYNLETHKIELELENLPGVVESVQFFDDQSKLYLVCRNQRGVIFDIPTKKIISNEKLFDEWPNLSVVTKDKRYIIVATRGNKLFVIRLLDNTVAFFEELEGVGISALHFANDLLVVGFSDGTVEFIDYTYGMAELELQLKVKNFRKAKDIFDKNQFLTLSKYMDIFYGSWPEVLKEAIDLIAKHQIESAVNLVEPFLFNEQRAQEFKFYTSQQDEIAHLDELMKSKKYILAMAYMDEFEFLKKLDAKIVLDKYWENAFSVVKKLIREDPVYNKEKIQEILRVFLAVPSKKDFVTNLMQNFEKLKDAEELIREKKFKDFYYLCSKYEFIKETELYDKVNGVGQRVYSQVVGQAQSSEYDKALESINTLSDFTPYEQKAKELGREIKTKKEFLQSLEEHDIKKSYNILQRNANLRYLPEYAELSTAFKNVVDEAAKYSFLGKPKTAMDILGIYLEIPYTFDKAISVVKVGYLSEIERSGTIEAGVDWPATLNLYVNLFGVDSELEYSCRKIPRAFEAFRDLFNEGNKDGFRRLKLPDTIIIER